MRWNVQHRVVQPRQSLLRLRPNHNEGSCLLKKMIGLVLMMGLVVSFVGCGHEDSFPTASSVLQDVYAETIIDPWEHMGEPFWAFSSDGTVEFVGWDILYNC